MSEDEFHRQRRCHEKPLKPFDSAFGCLTHRNAHEMAGTFPEDEDKTPSRGHQIRLFTDEF